MKRLLIISLLLLPVRSYAQTPATKPPGTVNVEVDPIRCWWRTSKGAVRIGETFDLSLTCAVLETEAVQVIPDESHLPVAVVAMSPFEVVGGPSPINLRSGARRFFQYQYTLRIINPDAIGKDVRIPDMVIHYKINSRVANNTSVQGRDLVYLLPQQSVKVESMVPSDATDIRDQTGESFGAGDALTLRAGTLEIIAIAFVILGSLMTIFVLVGLARGIRKRTPADERLMPTRRVAGAAINELNAVRRDRDAHGWNEALAGRALAATRIAAAGALGRPVNQRLAEAGAADGNGRVITGGGLRSKARMLSSPVTAADLARGAADATGSRHEMLDHLRQALATFTEAQYGRTATSNDSAMDEALTHATAAARQVKSEHAWIKTAVRQVFGGAAPAASRA